MRCSRSYVFVGIIGDRFASRCARKPFLGKERSGVEESIVIPVYNEEGNVRPLYECLSSVLQNLGKSYEIIFVDDGSTDRTLSYLEEVHAADQSVRVLSMRRNFGQTAAFAAGFDLARGNVIITNGRSVSQWIFH
jgi:GT2 family glycosyltransferase